MASMADKFDPYREALVVETDTVWPADLAGVSAKERALIERELHASPEQATSIEYVRVHTGFCRRITVTADDVARVASV
jgi:hypothetical protein